jgi:hypothetical protein
MASDAYNLSGLTTANRNSDGAVNRDAVLIRERAACEEEREGYQEGRGRGK